MMDSTILHEITEAELMKKGMSYNEAHKKSVKAELKAGIVPRKDIIENNKWLLKDIQSRNQEEDDDKPVFRGPHRKAREGEQWVKFPTPEGKTIIYLKKKRPTMKDVQDVLSSPWLSDDEKRLQLTKINANEGQERQARMNIRLRRGSRRGRY